jgi:hypothetical protein
VCRPLPVLHLTQPNSSLSCQVACRCPRSRCCSSFQNLFIKKGLSRCGTDSMDGEEGGTVTYLRSKKNDGGCVSLRPILHQVRPTAPVLPELRADVRSNSARHFRTCFIKEILALQMRGTDSHGWGGRRNLVTCQAEAKAVGVSAFYRTILHLGRCSNGSCPARLRADVTIKFRSSFQNLFNQRRYWLSDASTDSHGGGGRRNLVHVLAQKKRRWCVGLYRTILHQGA